MRAGHHAPAHQLLGRRLRTGAALVALVALVAVGCSSGDDEDTEVAGAVLERDGDGQPTGPSDPDDERVDPRDDDTAAGGNDAGDGDGAQAGAGAGDTTGSDEEAGAATDGSAGPPATGGTATSPGTGGPNPGTATPPTSASPSTPAPTAPPPDPGRARGEDPPATATPRTERRIVDNPYQPPPPPPPEPDPVDLPAGRGLTGTSVFFGPDDVELGGGAAAVQGAALRSDASHEDGRLSCATSVYAPSDRRLRVRGEVEVRIQHEDREGVVTELRRQMMRVDVTVPADQSLRLPAATPWPFERATTRSLRCESIHRPW